MSIHSLSLENRVGKRNKELACAIEPGKSSSFMYPEVRPGSGFFISDCESLNNGNWNNGGVPIVETRIPSALNADTRVDKEG